MAPSGHHGFGHHGLLPLGRGGMGVRAFSVQYFWGLELEGLEL